jgi:hypothetical protein
MLKGKRVNAPGSEKSQASENRVALAVTSPFVGADFPFPKRGWWESCLLLVTPGAAAFAA